MLDLMRSPNEIDLAAIRRAPTAPATAQRIYNALTARAFELRVMIAHYPKISAYAQDYITAVDLLEAMRNKGIFGAPSSLVEITPELVAVLGTGCGICGHRLAYRGALYCGARCSAVAEETG